MVKPVHVTICYENFIIIGFTSEKNGLFHIYKEVSDMFYT